MCHSVTSSILTQSQIWTCPYRLRYFFPTWEIFKRWCLISWKKMLVWTLHEMVRSIFLWGKSVEEVNILWSNVQEIALMTLVTIWCIQCSVKTEQQNLTWSLTCSLWHIFLPSSMCVQEECSVYSPSTQVTSPSTLPLPGHSSPTHLSSPSYPPSHTSTLPPWPQFTHPPHLSLIPSLSHFHTLCLAKIHPPT